MIKNILINNMGNNIYVDKTPSSIEKIISYSNLNIEKSLNEINNENHSYQHLNLWSLSESSITNDNYQEENTTTSIISNPIELSNIHQSRFLLDSHNVYIILLIFKKDKENLVENSPFPTGLWGIIESSSNMTPRGLLYAFPNNNNSQNLESFLLSKRELEDSEFKYMLFIWNGKKASAYLRSIALMKAFDLDKALSSPNLVQFLYNGFFIRKNNNNIVERSEPINMGDIINNTIENSEDSTPSSEKISNFHETVYLFKWLYPISDKKKKKKNKYYRKQKKKKILFK